MTFWDAGFLGILRVEYIHLSRVWVSVWNKQEAHGPQVAHLSSIASADMQMLCNIFLILSSQLMKRSYFKQFLILKKNIIYGMTVNGAWSFEQTLNHISTVGSMWNLVAIA